MITLRDFLFISNCIITNFFSYIIPEGVFIDAEDGTNLQFSMYDIEHIPLKPSSWVQFDPRTREVYGL